MSTTYKTIAGDTFDTVARKTTGDDTESRMIAFANPGIMEPLPAGTVLVIPDTETSEAETAADNPDEVAVRIDGVTFRFWETIRILKAADAITKIEFTTPFEPQHRAFRDVFRPLEFKPLTVTIGGQLYFTGRMGTITPQVSAARSSAAVPCFSLPALLEPPNAPAARLPLEFRGLNLRQIAQEMAGPFGITVELEGDPGPAFKKVACSPTDKVLGFLAGLAKQRGYVMSDTRKGALLFRQSSAPGNPVGRLVQGASPLLGVVPTFREGQYFSDVTGIKPTRSGRIGSQYTVKNPHLSGIVRPSNFMASDAEGGDLETATRARMGRMIGNAATYAARVATWRDPSEDGGQLWDPDTTVIAESPDAMIYNPYEFYIRTVEMVATSRVRTAALGLIMPGAFSGEIPEALPWDE